jgi:hypothetical protein
LAAVMNLVIEIAAYEHPPERDVPAKARVGYDSRQLVWSERNDELEPAVAKRGELREKLTVVMRASCRG